MTVVTWRNLVSRLARGGGVPSLSPPLASARRSENAAGRDPCPSPRSGNDLRARRTEAVAVLHHPNIVPIYDVGDFEGQPYFTMELVQGGSLADKMRGAPQPPCRAAKLAAVLADAIHEAHRHGIVHSDLKPGNVLLTGDGTPKVTDFGLAWRLDGGPELAFSGVPIGTPSYMSPLPGAG